MKKIARKVSKAVRKSSSNMNTSRKSSINSVGSDLGDNVDDVRGYPHDFNVEVIVDGVKKSSTVSEIADFSGSNSNNSNENYENIMTTSTMEGSLSKWTNVVNGWQYRWFVLDDNAGLLSYYTVSTFFLL